MPCHQQLPLHNRFSPSFFYINSPNFFSLFLPILPMAFKQSLVHRLFTISRISNQTLKSCRISPSSSAAQALIPPEPDKAAPDRGEETMFRRFLQIRPLYQSAATAVSDLRYLPAGEKLMEKLRGMSNVRDRIRLDGLMSPARVGELTVEDARKVLKLSQLEMVKAKLRLTTNNCVTYAEFVQICEDGCSSRDQGLEFAKLLDDSGTVIVLGNVVFLKPDQVIKAIHGLMPVTQPDPESPIMKELEEMEKVKFGIDKKAESMVRRELWAGLGFLVVQTAAFMRLTFWELSWDVMEPICFYVTSIYMMAGYAFFLRTSKEPSFEGFFQSRFNAKQKKLMKVRSFDVARYNELREACFPHPWPREKASGCVSKDFVDNSERMKSFT